MIQHLKRPLKPVRNLLLTVATNIVVCAVLFSQFEDGDRGPLGSLYWAVTTASTTGYGDISPQTTAGRVVAMWLMLTSLALFAVVTGTVAAAIIQDPHIFSDEEQEELKDDLDDVNVMLYEILDHFNIKVPDSVEEYSTYKERNANG